MYHHDFNIFFSENCEVKMIVPTNHKSFFAALITAHDIFHEFLVVS